MPIPRTNLKRINGKIPKLRVTAKIDFDYVMLSLYKKHGNKSQKLGAMRLNIDNKFLETHFSYGLSNKNKRHKYGVYLYSFAADFAAINGFILRSSGSPSYEAMRCWRSKTVKKYYQVYQSGYYHRMIPKKTTPYNCEVVNAHGKEWYIPVVDWV